MLTGYETDNAILGELGTRIKQRRIAMDITQGELSQESGVSMSTVVRIEQGEDTKVSNLIRVLRVLGLTENFDLLVPEQQPNFKDLYEKTPQRKRVRKKQNAQPQFIWGEDR